MIKLRIVALHVWAYACMALCISIALTLFVLLCSLDFLSAPKCTSEKRCEDQKQCHDDGKISTCRLFRYRGISWTVFCTTAHILCFPRCNAYLSITPCRSKIHSCHYSFYCVGPRKWTIPSKPDSRLMQRDRSKFTLFGLHRRDLVSFIQTHSHSLFSHSDLNKRTHLYTYTLASIQILTEQKAQTHPGINLWKTWKKE